MVLRALFTFRALAPAFHVCCPPVLGQVALHSIAHSPPGRAPGAKVGDGARIPGRREVMATEVVL
jgi:hypothetical protein